MSIQTHLTPDERKQVNAIFARVWKKFHAGATSQWEMIEPNTPLTMEEAKIVARAEFEATNFARIEQFHKRASHQISRQKDRLRANEERYNARVATINTDAQRRGLATSTIVMTQLERAVSEKHAADQIVEREIVNAELTRENNLARLSADTDRRVEALAKRIHMDSMRMNLAAFKERCEQQSRAYRDMLQMQQVRMVTPINAQQLIDDELHGAYMHWLFTNKTPAEARSLLNNEPVFTWNLSAAGAVRLRNEIVRRSI